MDKLQKCLNKLVINHNQLNQLQVRELQTWAGVHALTICLQEWNWWEYVLLTKLIEDALIWFFSLLAGTFTPSSETTITTGAYVVIQTYQNNGLRNKMIQQVKIGSSKKKESEETKEWLEEVDSKMESIMIESEQNKCGWKNIQ